MAKRDHLIQDRQLERACGYALIIAGAWLLYDGYERRGVSRPFLTKFLPGG